MQTIRNRRGNIILQNQYDIDGRVSRQTDALGGLYRYSYAVTQANGRPVVTSCTYTDPRNVVTTYNFSIAGHANDITSASGTSDAFLSSYPRGAASTVSSVALSTLPSVELQRDANGYVNAMRTIGTGNAVLSETLLERDANERVTKETNPLGKQRLFEYDTKGRLTKFTDPLGRTGSATYDTFSRLLTATDARGKITRYAYTGLDLSQITDPLGRKINFTSDLLGRTVRVTDPLGNSVTLEYDVMDRVSKATDARGSTVQYEYDAVAT
ncbi:MAG: RHS repeat protein [Pleurocapsa sp. SU_196_0]|nr:RHS repeat protein [Pleurocapsa sp. SU_196_0]